MSPFKCVPSPKIADETIGAPDDDDSGETRLPLPKVESELFRPEIASLYSLANEAKSQPANAKHIETGPDITTMPVDQVSARVSRKGIIVAAMLGLAAGIAINGEWSLSQSSAENLKANLRGVVETVFAGSSKTEQSAKFPQPPSDATDATLREIADQLVALAEALSTMQQNMKELATTQQQIRKDQAQLAQTQSIGQDQIRKTQEQLAQTQSRFLALQAQTNLKQNPQPRPHSPDGRKLNHSYPSR